MNRFCIYDGGYSGRTDDERLKSLEEIRILKIVLAEVIIRITFTNTFMMYLFFSVLFITLVCF